VADRVELSRKMLRDWQTETRQMMREVRVMMNAVTA
jgi:hypothetical protein